MENPEQLIRKGVHHERLKEGLVKTLLGSLTWGVVFVALLIFGRICWDGLPVLFKPEAPFVDVAFLTERTQTLHVFDDSAGTRHSLPADQYHAWIDKNGSEAVFNETSYSYSGGGIAGPIVGTALLTLLSTVLALFFGVAAAIYLSEYAKQGRFIQWVGFTYFSFQGWNSSLIAGSATLACMILPVIITASEESLKAVPQGFREASLALGATRWHTIRKCVLPFALPGILTSSVLSLARAAGETAPIMFTAAVAAKDTMPWEGEGGILGTFQSQVQALPYHIYTLAARIPTSDYTQRAQYGSVFVFLLMIFLFSTVSIVLRNRVRAKLKW
ncbi:MAG: phosphate ABC transporter, permease protein PstA [Verrucomicrobiaceae bacterium]|nr:MAG: phosphate ABC transporter, permease protein PstA [Verrucomicrobiaceae bacterium]